MMKIQIKEQLTLEDFYQMEEIEKRYYSSEYITPAEEGYQWYLKRKNSILVAEYEGNIVGFLCLFPVGGNIAQQIKAGIYNDSFMTYEDILDTKQLVGERVTLFLSCVLVETAYRKMNPLAVIFDRYIQYYHELEKQGVVIDEVLIDNVTESGERFSRTLGFEEITLSDHGSVVYGIPYSQFVQKVVERYMVH